MANKSKAKKAQKLAHRAKVEASHKNDMPKIQKPKVVKPKEKIVSGGTTAEQRLEYWKKRANDTLSRSWVSMTGSMAETMEMMEHSGADSVKIKDAMTVLGVSMAQLVKEVNVVSLLKNETPKASKGGSHAEVKKNKSR